MNRRGNNAVMTVVASILVHAVQMVVGVEFGHLRYYLRIKFIKPTYTGLVLDELHTWRDEFEKFLHVVACRAM